MDTLQPKQLREDLQFLLDTIEQVHPNMYAYTSEDRFTRLKAAVFEQIERPMSRVEFFKQVGPLIASLQNMHTVVRPPTDDFEAFKQGGGKVFPIVRTVSARGWQGVGGQSRGDR